MTDPILRRIVVDGVAYDYDEAANVVHVRAEPPMVQPEPKVRRVPSLFGVAAMCERAAL